MSITVIVFLALFLFVALLGLLGSRWRAGDLSQLHEWGLGGRSFGTVITWFLLGGDLYTAYLHRSARLDVRRGRGVSSPCPMPLMYPLLFRPFRAWSVARPAMSPPPISCAAASVIAAWRWPSQ